MLFRYCSACLSVLTFHAAEGGGGVQIIKQAPRALDTPSHNDTTYYCAALDENGSGSLHRVEVRGALHTFDILSVHFGYRLRSAGHSRQTYENAVCRVLARIRIQFRRNTRHRLVARCAIITRHGSMLVCHIMAGLGSL